MGGHHTRAGAVLGLGDGPGARVCMFACTPTFPTFGHLGEGVSVSRPCACVRYKGNIHTHTQHTLPLETLYLMSVPSVRPFPPLN